MRVNSEVKHPYVCAYSLFLDYILVVNRRIKMLDSLVQNRDTSSGIFVATNCGHMINRSYIYRDIFECIFLFNKLRREFE